MNIVLILNSIYGRFPRSIVVFNMSTLLKHTLTRDIHTLTRDIY